MRLWSLHPKYLDPQGLVALWREALLAQKVLSGRTTGYKNHPQLERFKQHARPQAAIATYLFSVWQESLRRGYHFEKKKIGRRRTVQKIPVTCGQLVYEARWLSSKLRKRSPDFLGRPELGKKLVPHPSFRVTRGPVEQWEKIRA